MSIEVTDHPNIADVDYPVHDLIQRRWSPRSFSDEPVNTELLRKILMPPGGFPHPTMNNPGAL